MRSTTIGAYLYDQYSDDENLQAFIDAFNAAQQYYLDWFNSIGLPCPSGLSGDLLDWVSQGRYDTQRQSIVLDTVNASGMLNTQMLDTEPLNSFVEPASITLAMSDDVLKRILTWNLYKGDGKRFTMKWLKRRIMRFLVGANGLDPNPLDPSFTVGPEDTTAISVDVANDVLTVTINGVLLSQNTQLDPDILYIFQSAFLGGVLDLPLQYQYSVDIVASVSLIISPTSETVVGIATTLHTGTAIAAALGGDGQYTFSWSWQSGGTGISIDNSLQAETTFTATGMTRGTTRSGIAQCTVTDAGSNSAVATIPVTIKNISAVTLALSPTSLSVSGASSSETTGSVSATATGGGAPYTYAWTWQTGGSGIAIVSPAGSSTTFSASGLAPNTTLTGTAKCTVTDSYGQTASATVSVSITRASSLSATLTPGTITDVTAVSPATTVAATMTPSGGQAPYTYSWVWNSGGANIAINSPTSQSTTFTGSGMSPGGTYSGVAWCTVTDAYGQTYTLAVSVSIEYTQLTLSASPSSLSVTSDTSTETTASTTVSASSGVAPYTYSWSWQSGGSGIVINSPSSASTSFTGTGIAAGGSLSGTALCTVSDSAGHQASIAVPVSINRVSLPAVSVSPSSLSVTGATPSNATASTTATASGGQGPYTYAWTFQSGGSVGIVIGSPSSATTSFSTSGLTPGLTRNAVALVTVTDSFGQTATATVSVSIGRVTTVSLATSPTSLSVTGVSATETTANTTATGSGGSGTYTYAWTWQSGGTGITIGSPSAAVTNFSASSLATGQTVSGVALVTATDAYGQTATSTVSVSLSRASTVSASTSPTSETASSSTLPITTGSTTVTASGGSGSYTYAWSWQSGGAGIAINSATSRTTSFTASSLSSGQTATGTAKCVVTDGYGQTATVTCSVSITYLPPLLRTYTSGSGIETVPAGYRNVVIEDIGGDGSGGAGFTVNQAGEITRYGGGGSGGPGYCRSSYAVSAGQTIAWRVGAGALPSDQAGTASVVSSGTLVITTMTANPGLPGANSSGATAPGGAGGTASGGNQANTSGTAGTAGDANARGLGGTSATGVHISAHSGASGGLGSGAAGSAGPNGIVAFYYT